MIEPLRGHNYFQETMLLCLGLVNIALLNLIPGSPRITCDVVVILSFNILSLLLIMQWVFFCQQHHLMSR